MTTTSPNTRAGSTRAGTSCASNGSKRLVDDGIIHPNWQLTDRDPTQPPWTEAEHREWTLRCMEVYAAQIDRMDQGIGRIVAALEETGQLDNTLAHLPVRQRRLRRGHSRRRHRATNSSIS